MSNNAAWLLLSFGIMVVAVLATLYEKVQRLEQRLTSLEGEGEPDDDGLSPRSVAGIATAALPRRDHGAR